MAWVGSNEKYMDHIQLWTRFIDDLFVIWEGSKDLAIEFTESLESEDLNLKFTSITSAERVEFLDVRVEIIDNVITTKLFRKESAGNSILHASSSHPPH